MVSYRGSDGICEDNITYLRVALVAGVKDTTYKYQFDPLNSRHPIACDHVRVKARTVVAKLG
jgi:hypothetical protein